MRRQDRDHDPSIERTPAPPLLSVDEVARQLGVGSRFVRRLVAERRIGYVKVGRFVRFRADVVDAFVAQGEVPSGHPRTRPVDGRRRP